MSNDVRRRDVLRDELIFCDGPDPRCRRVVKYEFIGPTGDRMYSCGDPAHMRYCVKKLEKSTLGPPTAGIKYLDPSVHIGPKSRRKSR